jgi:hypothetical protein
MKFGRADYTERIVDKAGQIPEDEPCFLIRGADEFGPHNLMDYAARCEDRGLTEMAAGVRAHAARMREWQQLHGSKLPDAPDSDRKPAGRK